MVEIIPTPGFQLFNCQYSIQLKLLTFIPGNLVL